MHILSAASIVLLVNVPFGYWRVNENKFSVRWFAAVHAPVLLVVAVRLLSGLGWQLVTFPLMVTAFFCGQFAGGFIHRLRKPRSPYVTSCLISDMLKTIRDSVQGTRRTDA